MSSFEKLFSFALLILFGAVAALFMFSLRTGNATNLPAIVGGTENKNSENIAKQLDDPAALESIVLSQINASASATIDQLSQKIDNLTASSSTLLERIEKLEKNSGKTSVGATSPTFQRQIFYLGSTNTTSRDWTNSDAEIKLNSADYPSNANAYFEVGMSIVGGEAWARLINKTTGAIMAITEVSHSTSDTTWKTSPAFKLFSGNHNYTLQVKSSSGETANFSGARIVVDK